MADDRRKLKIALKRLKICWIGRYTYMYVYNMPCLFLLYVYCIMSYLLRIIGRKLYFSHTFRCWNVNPDVRPSMANVIDEMGQLLQVRFCTYIM